MKDTEFIELLNLYLDHEISAVDAARLEAEVQSNPARRRLYEDYCRMQKACHILARDFQTDQPVETAGRKVVDFESARRSRASFYTVGAFAAAAACIAIIFVGQNRRQHAAPVGAGQEFAQVVAPLAAPNTALAQSATAPVSPDVTPISVPAEGALARDFMLARDVRSQARLTTSVEQANAQFEWMRNLQFAPLQQPATNDALRFEVHPTLSTESKTYRSRQPVDATIEMTAWRFQR